MHIWRCVSSVSSVSSVCWAMLFHFRWYFDHYYQSRSLEEQQIQSRQVLASSARPRTWRALDAMQTRTATMRKRAKLRRAQNQNQNNQVLRKNFFSWSQFETPLTILFGLILNGSCWERFWSKCSSAFIWLNHNSMYIFFCEASTKFGRWQEQVQCPSEIWSRAFQMDLA